MKSFVCKHRLNELARMNHMRWEIFALLRWHMLARMQPLNSARSSRSTVILVIQWKNSIELKWMPKEMSWIIWTHWSNVSRKNEHMWHAANHTFDVFVPILVIRTTSTVWHRTVVQLNQASHSVVIQKQNQVKKPTTNCRLESFWLFW